MSVTVIVSLVAVAMAMIWLFFKHRHGYWARRGVPSPPATIPFGHLSSPLGKQTASFRVVERIYHQCKSMGDFCGIFFFHQPVVLALSMDFVKQVLIKNFSAFQDRGVYYNEKDDPLSAHLFSLEAAKWRSLRTKLTPTFTSGRMKFMFPTILQVADEFSACLEQLIQTSGDGVLEMKELLARFTTDIIGTCAFGIECNSLKDPEAQFRAMGRKVFGAPRYSGFVRFLILSFKDLARALHLKNNHDDVSDFFMRIVRETIDMREKQNIRRNDFMDLLIEMKNSGSIDGTQIDSLSVEEIAAQAFVFFLAGFETSSTTLSYALYELALNVDIQTKGRNEINAVLKMHNGHLTYEAMLEMHYIDHIINESLRKYPPGASLIRQATEKFQVPESGLVIDKGTIVMISVYGIHHDPEYYPNPERFDPDRFEPDMVAERPSSSFLAFGDGPRNCIGLRFGMMQARIGLIMLLKNFKFSQCARTITPLEFESNKIVLTAKGGLFLKFQKI